MTKVAGNYGYTLTLLVMPEAERRWRRDEDEEPVEDILCWVAGFRSTHRISLFPDHRLISCLTGEL